MRDAVVTALSRDGGRSHAYAKWKGAFWRLISLVDLGVPRGHQGAVAAAESSLDWAASPRRLAEIHRRRIDGRVRRCASQDGQVLRCCLAVGVDDPRLDTLAESLVQTQWPDGGWNCDRKPHVTALLVQRVVGADPGPGRVRRAGRSERGRRVLPPAPRHLLTPTGEVAHPNLPLLRFPAFWHYGLLPGLRTLAACGRLDEPRVADALDLLESKRRSDGSWRVEGKWWKRPGSAGSNVEVVDWGDTANEVLTEHALGVLDAAGRL